MDGKIPATGERDAEYLSHPAYRNWDSPGTTSSSWTAGS